MTTEPAKLWRPSRIQSGKFEYGTIEKAERQGVYQSEMCDIANALEARLALVEGALDKARRITDDLTEQAYESTTQGGVFFDTLKALHESLNPTRSVPASAEE